MAAPACLLWLLVFAAWPLQAGPVSDRAQREFALPEPSLQTAQRLRLRATYYYTYEAKAAADGVPFGDRHGRPLSDPVDPRDWCVAAVQGSVRAPRNGSIVTLSLAGEGATLILDCATIVGDRYRGAWVDAVGRSYFAPAIAPLGSGVENFRLVPFRTIAVDPSVIPFGSILYIPEARGVAVEAAPGVWIRHDGFFFAGDEGPNIKDEHIDIFCGASAESCFPGFAGISEGHSVDVYLIRDRSISRYLTRAHRNDRSRAP